MLLDNASKWHSLTIVVKPLLTELTCSSSEHLALGGGGRNLSNGSTDLCSSWSASPMSTSSGLIAGSLFKVSDFNGSENWGVLAWLLGDKTWTIPDGVLSSNSPAVTFYVRQ